MHGLVRCKLERRCWRARGEDVSFTDVKIKVPYRKVDPGIWMTSCTGSARGGFWGCFEKSQWVEFLARKKKVDFRELTVALWRVRRWFGGDGKVSIERWYLSPYVEKPFNSKVINSFVPELRSRKCFSCFGIPMFYVYMLWTFYVCFTYPYHGYVTLSLLLWCDTQWDSNSLVKVG